MRLIDFSRWQVVPNDIRSQMVEMSNQANACLKALGEYEAAQQQNAADLPALKKKLYDELNALESFRFVQ